MDVSLQWDTHYVEVIHFKHYSNDTDFLLAVWVGEHTNVPEKLGMVDSVNGLHV